MRIFNQQRVKFYRSELSSWIHGDCDHDFDRAIDAAGLQSHSLSQQLVIGSRFYWEDRVSRMSISGVAMEALDLGKTL